MNGEQRIEQRGDVATMAQSDTAFCRDLLPQVSRTFALSIEALPEGLRDAVRTAYLLCRIVDTIEDEPDLALPVRCRLFQAFDQLVERPESDPGLFEHLSRSLWLGEPEAEGRLCAEAGRVFGAFGRLAPGQREAIRPHVLEMSRGMLEYSKRAHAEGALRLRDEDDLERYCYFVAGTVGELLTALFERAVPSLDRATRQAARERAISFGLGLQLVNIVKDVAADFRRSACYLPQNTARAEGIALDQILDPSRRAAALGVVRTVCRRARIHLDRAAEYTALWPQREGAAVRLFCLVPLALALATLAEVEAGEDTLRPDRTPKVSREVVARVLAEARVAAHDDRALLEMLTRYGATTGAPSGPPAQPRPPGPPPGGTS